MLTDEHMNAISSLFIHILYLESYFHLNLKGSECIGTCGFGMFWSATAAATQTF